MDFSDVDFYDPAWGRKQRLFFDAIQRENDRELYNALQRHSLAVLGAPWLTETSVDKQQKTAIGIMDHLLALYRPWEYGEKGKEDREKEEFQGLRDSWQDVFGSLDDPRVQKKLANLREALLRKKADEHVPESPLGNQGIFNKDTADQIGNLKTLQRETDATHSPAID